jgi:hypothetical protein
MRDFDVTIRIGLLTEGHDHLILRAYLAKLLGVLDEEIEADYPDGTGHGHGYVAATIDRALRRFYNQCAQLAIISMDNDGNLDLLSSGGQEDPRHPRHWLHTNVDKPNGCRWCFIHDQVEQTRPALNWIPTKPSLQWPVVIAVPVESIEAWLLTTQAILVTGTGSLHAEQERRATYKMRLYRRPAATLEDVQTIALPMIRQLEPDHLQTLRDHSRSFSDFADQIKNCSDELLTAPPCW